MAAQRELREESGYSAHLQDLEKIGFFNWTILGKHITFGAYKLNISEKFDVQTNPGEHTTSLWIPPEECYHKPNLIAGFQEILEHVYQIKENV